IFQSLEEINEEAAFQSENTRPGDIRFKDLNNDGIINEADQTFLGSPLPDFTANLNNTISYANFDLNILFQGVFGNEILNLVRRSTEGFVGNENQSIIALDRWTPTNPSETVPRAISSDPNDNRRISDRFIEDGSFIRLRNLSLGYTLPTAIAQKVGMTSARVYISGQNLITITNYSGFDPEIGSFNQNPLINGVDNGRYPISRSYTVGLNVNF
ncbi:MAG: SusC/RagA family TonB-linked outer membrane protein, partial [Bacteroidota bacterium]